MCQVLHLGLWRLHVSNIHKSSRKESKYWYVHSAATSGAQTGKGRQTARLQSSRDHAPHSHPTASSSCHAPALRVLLPQGPWGFLSRGWEDTLCAQHCSPGRTLLVSPENYFVWRLSIPRDSVCMCACVPVCDPCKIYQKGCCLHSRVLLLDSDGNCEFSSVTS